MIVPCFVFFRRFLVFWNAGVTLVSPRLLSGFPHWIKTYTGSLGVKLFLCPECYVSRVMLGRLHKRQLESKVINRCLISYQTMVGSSPRLLSHICHKSNLLFLIVFIISIMMMILVDCFNTSVSNKIWKIKTHSFF